MRTKTTAMSKYLNQSISIQFDYFGFAVLTFGPAGVFCHRLLYRNGTFVPPIRQQVETDFRQKRAIVGDFMSGKGKGNFLLMVREGPHCPFCFPKCLWEF